MAKRTPSPTSLPKERAFLVGVEIQGDRHSLSLEDSLAELALLAETAGLEVVGQTTQKLARPHPNMLIGSGKVEELHALAEDTLAQVVVFDDELIPRHQRELEKALGSSVRVLDRTAVILDIFAQHAHTSEGQLQVRLAQYEYFLPRLTGQWTHLARQAGGGGGRTGSTGGVGLRGPGETQLEVDRRAIRREITHLKDELEKVRAHRLRHRLQRKRSRIPTLAVVGYTNAGKSTLLNALTRSNVLVADQLFATLDPTTRRFNLPHGNQALLTDTVGFIQKLPTALVAAFRATLEEIAEADLLLHVVDISHPNAINQAAAVQETLAEIEAGHVPVITVLNKIDRLGDPAAAAKTVQLFPRSVAISALQGTGLPALTGMINELLFESFLPCTVRLPYREGQLISLYHEFGQVERTEHGRKTVFLHGRLPGRLIAQFMAWQVPPNSFKEPEDDEVAEQADR